MFVVTNANMIFDPPFSRPGPPCPLSSPPVYYRRAPASTPWLYPPLELRSSISARIKQSTRSGTGGCTGCTSLLAIPVAARAAYVSTRQRTSPYQTSCHRLKRFSTGFIPLRCHWINHRRPQGLQLCSLMSSSIMLQPLFELMNAGCAIGK